MDEGRATSAGARFLCQVPNVHAWRYKTKECQVGGWKSGSHFVEGRGNAFRDSGREKLPITLLRQGRFGRSNTTPRQSQICLVFTTCIKRGKKMQPRRNRAHIVEEFAQW